MDTFTKGPELNSAQAEALGSVSPEKALRTAAAWAYSDERTLLAHACLSGADTIADLLSALREAREWLNTNFCYEPIGGGVEYSSPRAGEIAARIDAALKKAGG